MSQAPSIDTESALKAVCRTKIMELGKELMLSGVKLKSSQGEMIWWKRKDNFGIRCLSIQDRLQMFLWLKKLNEFQANQLSDLKLKHEYLEYLRVTLQGKYRVLTKPFNSPPPEILVPFAECIANKTADVIPETPRAGWLL